VDRIVIENTKFNDYDIMLMKHKANSFITSHSLMQDLQKYFQCMHTAQLPVFGLFFGKFAYIIEYIQKLDVRDERYVDNTIMIIHSQN